MVTETQSANIQKLQQIEQNLQTYISQKQNFQGQLIEINSALDAIGSSSENFQILGNIMVKKDNSELKEELEKKKNKVQVQIKTIEKHESELNEQANKIQSELQQDIKDRE